MGSAFTVAHAVQTISTHRYSTFSEVLVTLKPSFDVVRVGGTVRQIPVVPSLGSPQNPLLLFYFTSLSSMASIFQSTPVLNQQVLW